MRSYDHERFSHSFAPLLLGLCAWAGCAREEGELVKDPIALGLLPADWEGTAMGVELPKFRDRGEVEIVRAMRPRAEDVRIHPSSGEFEHVPESEVELVDGRSKHLYQVTLPEGIERVAAARAASLAAELSSIPPASEPPTGEKVISGPDGRVRLGIADGIRKDDWMAAIGQTDVGASGVLISRSAYLTTAHSLFTQDGKFQLGLFYPRIDHSGSEPDYEVPYGAYEDEKILVPAAFTRNDCQRNYREECGQYDIALVLVKRESIHPDNKYWFVPRAETRAELSSRELKNRGYPTCDHEHAPAKCASGGGFTLFGEREPCRLGDDWYPDDTYSSLVFHTCDTSDGHSGSPIFYYQANGSPVVVGLHVGGGGKHSQPAINWFKRFSPNTLKWINGLVTK